MAGIRVVQVNLQHSRAASAALSVLMRDFEVALIQEPWINKGKIVGLGPVGGELIYCRSSEIPRDLVAVKIRGEGKAMPKEGANLYTKDLSEPAKDQLGSIQNRPRHWSEGDNTVDKERHRT
ncbi:hypothetical protein NQ315_014770 [Exocentrus adspersus]|uniref:Endonuclease/exonuclease/phosphatase domain-containing protein n=1 Tax=Exocentrus adspersus TaxID=1586481 RepID=A0AAV8VM27_9CUCU|nr:hypothetical protein NQ315_014770 [Exocentrus adspersus]